MADLGKLKNWKKVDLARVVVQALFNLDDPPQETNIHVKRRQRAKKAVLIQQATWAIEIINKGGRRTGMLVTQ